MNADVEGALGWISPDIPRDEWVRVLMAIKNELGEGGKEIARHWSAGSDKYRAADFESTWRSIRTDGGITSATLFSLARQAGYRPDARAPERPHTPRKVEPLPPPTTPYARAIWQRARREDDVVSAHPYAIRKEIHHAAGAGRAKASGTKIGKDADVIVVPYRTVDGEFVGVECINADGAKQTFGSKGILILGNDLDAGLPIMVLEGWASAVHALNAFDWNACAVVAGGKGRLQPVAEELDRRNPKRRIVILGEVDG